MRKYSTVRSAMVRSRRANAGQRGADIVAHGRQEVDAVAAQFLVLNLGLLERVFTRFQLLL
jgi:hypothetical protein